MAHRRSPSWRAEADLVQRQPPIECPASCAKLNRWKPEYQRWVDMQAGLHGGSGAAIVAWNQAQTSDMIFTQPVVHEFPRIRVPTVLIVGDKDRTAPGANRAPPAVAATLGRYDLLGPAAAKAIPAARLIAFPELGHSPQVEAPERFHAALLPVLLGHD